MNFDSFKTSSFLFIFALLSQFVGMQAFAQNQVQYQSAVVKGKVMDPWGPQYQLEDLTETGALRGAAMKFNIGPDSTFRLQVNLNGPTYIRVGMSELYISPGDSIQGEFYWRSPGKQSKLSGPGSVACNYLQSNPDLRNGSFLGNIPADELLPLKDDGPKLEERIQVEAQARLQTLESTKDVDQSFLDYEKGRIEAGVINSLLAFPSFYIAKGGVQGSKPEIEALMEQMFDSYLPQVLPHLEKINQGQLLNVPDCRDILFMLNQRQDQTRKFQFPWQTYVRSFYLTRLILNAIGSGNISQINSEVERLKGLDALAANHVQLIDAALKPYKTLMAGAPAIDFKIEDTNGKIISLSDFKGKVIVVDFWATWCGPCRKEAPYFEQIKSQFPDMEFLSISTDQDKNKWLNFVKAKPSQEGHFRVASNDYGQYQVTSIPRFLVIGKDFTIADAYAARPSGGMASYLQSLK